MSALVRIPVGVVVERRKAMSQWADFVWQPVAVLPEHARDLEKRRVADGVVANTIVPRVVMPVEQHEWFGLDRSGNRHDGYG